MTSPKVDPRARRRARRALLQALYQAQLSGADAAAMCSQFRLSGALDQADTIFFDTCLHQILEKSNKLDEAYRPFLDRSNDKLGYVERGVLRAGTFELLECADVPFRVVINEWVELAKIFGAEQSFKFVNGVLDAVARDVRDSD